MAQEHSQVIETAFLVDADICRDTLSRAVALAKGLNDTADFRTRFVGFGSVGPDSALSDLPQMLGPLGQGAEKHIKVFYLPRSKGPVLLEAARLVRSQALSGCDLLHCFSESILDMLASVPCRRLFSPWCLSLSYWPGEKTVRQLARLGDRPGRRIVCLSPALQKNLIAGGVPARCCSVIAPELPAQDRAVERQEARRQLKIPQEADLLLADPEISCLSNHRQLTWAAAIIGQFNRRLRVLIPGCNGKIEHLRAFDDSLNPPSLGIYPGRRFDPAVLYAAADLLVLPATGPVSPVPILRAARARLPIIASDTPAFGEYLRHEQNALLYAPGKHNAGDRTCRRIRPLATAIVRLLEDRSLAQQLADQLENDIRLGPVSSPTPSLPTHLQLYRQMTG